MPEDLGESEQYRQFSSEVSSAAFTWIASVKRSESAAIWSGLDPNFRLVLVQQWIHDNPAIFDDPYSTEDVGRDELAGILALATPWHQLWEDCERVSMRAIKSATAGIENVELGQGPRTRAISVDLEIVHLIPLQDLPTDADGHKFHPPGVAVVGLPLVMHLMEGEWKVAGIGPRLSSPGWPPIWTELPLDLVQ